MSISFSGSTLTFSDSTTMTTAASLIAGPTGPTGGTGPTGPAGSNASVVTTYGAVGSYVTAFYTTGGTGFIRAGCTVSGACLYRGSDSWMSNNACYQGGGMNMALAYGAYSSPVGSAYSSQITNLSLSGTWRAMATLKSKQCCKYYINDWLRIS